MIITMSMLDAINAITRPSAVFFTLPLLSLNYVQKTQIIQQGMQLQHDFW